MKKAIIMAMLLIVCLTGCKSDAQSNKISYEQLTADYNELESSHDQSAKELKELKSRNEQLTKDLKELESCNEQLTKELEELESKYEAEILIPEMSVVVVDFIGKSYDLSIHSKMEAAIEDATEIYIDSCQKTYAMTVTSTESNLKFFMRNSENMVTELEPVKSDDNTWLLDFAAKCYDMNTLIIDNGEKIVYTSFNGK